jgi:SAM-dependent methyltransferase
MGRYSAQLAGPFVGVAGVRPGMSVLDVGCGTGALTGALADLVGAEHVAAVDPSEAFVATCRRRVPEAEVLVAGGESLPFTDARFAAVLSQLVINFVQDAPATVAEMRRVAHPQAVIAACVWDYRDGMTLLRSFWDAAIELGLPQAVERDQGRTMPYCDRDELSALWRRAGLDNVGTGDISVNVTYQRYDDIWTPLEQGISPAGVYVTSLAPSAREALRGALQRRLGSPQAPFRLPARAFWVRGQR